MAEILDLMNLEINIPPTDFGEYTTLLAAPPKFGKTEFCTQFDQPLILDFEKGSSGKVTYRVPIQKWSEVQKYVKQLISNDQLKNKYKTICFDTMNFALAATKQYIVDKAQRENPEKVIDTFNKVGYGNWDELESEINTAVNDLKHAGYGIVLIAHIKDKTYNRNTEDEYSKRVPDMTDREKNMLSAMADFYLLGDFETEVIEAAKKDKNTKKVIKKAVIETRRVLYLRGNKDIEAGFRWRNVPEKIPFTVEALKDAFNQGIRDEIETGKIKFGLTDNKINEITDKLNIERETQRVESFNENTSELLKDTIEEIKLTAKAKAKEGINVKEIINPILGEGFPKNVTSTEEANKILQELKNL